MASSRITVDGRRAPAESLTIMVVCARLNAARPILYVDDWNCSTIEFSCLGLYLHHAGAIVAGHMVTKRQLGLIFILLGLGAAVAMFAVDLLGAGQFQGIGPAQQRALLVAGLAVVVGLTLLPLGDRPA
jgi:hypothetical protein